MINLVLADDHTMIRDGLKFMLSDADPEIKVAGEVSSGKELITLLTNVEADVVLLDLFMPGMDGLQAARYLSQHFPQVKIIVLTVTNHEKYIREALQAGVSGYLLKNTDQIELLHAIQSVIQGKKYLSSQIAIDLLAYNPAAEISLNKSNLLSKRELEVLRLIAQGYTNAEIAEKLFVSKRTIEIHRQNMLEKTSTRNTANLITYAFRNQLLHTTTLTDEAKRPDFIN